MDRRNIAPTYPSLVFKTATLKKFISICKTKEQPGSLILDPSHSSYLGPWFSLFPRANAALQKVHYYLKSFFLFFFWPTSEPEALYQALKQLPSPIGNISFDYCIRFWQVMNRCIGLSVLVAHISLKGKHEL